MYNIYIYNIYRVTESICICMYTLCIVIYLFIFHFPFYFNCAIVLKTVIKNPFITLLGSSLLAGSWGLIVSCIIILYYCVIKFVCRGFFQILEDTGLGLGTQLHYEASEDPCQKLTKHCD